MYITYSRVRNKLSGTLNFGEKFHPRHAYSNHPVYLNLKHFPHNAFITDAFLRKISYINLFCVQLLICFTSILLYALEESMHQFPIKKRLQIPRNFYNCFYMKAVLLRFSVASLQHFLGHLRMFQSLYNEACRSVMKRIESKV